MIFQETDSKNLKDLLTVKYSQLNSLLEVTKAINDNVSSDVLFNIYKFIINEQLKVNKKRPALLQAFYLKIFRQCYSTEIIFLVAV